jgi:polyisoprenyl-teichoic acid--peptidoglycan teichoic acid transferase
VLIGVAVIVVIVTSLTGGGSGSHSAAKSSSTSSAHVTSTHSSSHTRQVSTEASSPAASPAETTVAVLNGTGTTGLAHAISSNLRQNGYSQAEALDGRPAGANQVSVVEYTTGHKAEAEGVARSLSVTKVQPIEATTASLAGSASVVVIVGLDKAATVP